MADLQRQAVREAGRAVIVAALRESPRNPRHGISRMRSNLGLLITAYVAFIGLGLPDAVTGVAWPSIRDTFGLEQNGLGLILFAVAAGYLTSSAFAGTLVQRMRLGNLLALSTFVVVMGLLAWSVAPSFLLLLVFAPLLGLGGGAIDAAMNLYVATRFGPRQLNWLHAFFGFGATLGPLLMTAVLSAPGGSWRSGIVLIALILTPLGILYALTRRAWDLGAEAEAAAGDRESPATMARTLAQGRVWLQVAAFFVLTGFEATAGQWSFTLLTEARGLSTAAAGAWVGAFWAAFTVGRIAAGFVVHRIGSLRLMRLAALGMVVGAGLFALNPTPLLGGLGLVIAGFSCAPIFPGLMAETPRRLGPALAAHAVGFQVSGAILGAASLPAVAGLAADAFGLPVIAFVLLATGLVFLALNEALGALLDRSRVG